MSSFCTVPIPWIFGLHVPKRLPRIWSRLDVLENIAYTFYPPNSLELWPRTIGDITDVLMKDLLVLGGPEAVGGNLS